MTRFFAILVLAFLSSSLAAQDVDPFIDANAIVIHARLKALSRTDALQPWYDGDSTEGNLYKPAFQIKFTRIRSLAAELPAE